MKNNIERVALYVRANNPETKRDNAIEPQLEKCKQFCEAQGYTIAPEHIYSDISSGLSSATERPGLSKLLKDAKNHSFDILVVYKIDRLARKVLLVLKVIQELEKHSVKLQSVTEPIDTQTAFGRSAISMFASFAEYEHAMIQERRSETHKEYVGR